MPNSAIGFVDIAKRSAAQTMIELNGRVLTRPALLTTDGLSLTYAVDVDIGSGAQGGLKFQGVYNADANDPELPDPSWQNIGYYYKVNVAGGGWQVNDWIVSDGSIWYKLTSLNETLKNVPLARANVDLLYAEVGNPCRLRRTANGQWEVIGFSKEMPGTYTRFGVNLTDLTFGPVEDFTVVARPLTYDELATYGGYGLVPYGAIGVFRGGILQEIR